MNSYGGDRPLTLYKRNGKYYLWNGNSSDKIYACIRENKLCVVTCRDSKERHYSTTAEKYAYGLCGGDSLGYWKECGVGVTFGFDKNGRLNSFALKNDPQKYN